MPFLAEFPLSRDPPLGSEGLASCPKVVLYVSLVSFPFSQLGENLLSDNIGIVFGETKDKSLPGKNDNFQL